LVPIQLLIVVRRMAMVPPAWDAGRRRKSAPDIFHYSPRRTVCQHNFLESALGRSGSFQVPGGVSDGPLLEHPQKQQNQEPDEEHRRRNGGVG
jgi:hypothetical protein